MSTTMTAVSSSAAIFSQNRVLWLYAATIFTSAFLLFSVQPIFAKMLLPKLGGAPAVWAVSMCFFQAALLAGYAYAHLLNRFATPRIVPLVHLGVLTLALLALPFGIPAGSNPPENPSYLWLMSTLAAGVGLPFFAVSANAPLLQTWFARTGHPHAGDPYFLYGASNVGSLLALLAYPFLVEPWLGLSVQASTWSAGYVLLVALIAMSAGAMIILARTTTDEPKAAQASIARLTTGQRLTWIALAFVPSGLLTALSTHISTDIASMPLLWVIPLAIYLSTFMIAFRDRPLVPGSVLSTLAAPLAALATLLSVLPGHGGLIVHLVVTLAAFFVLVTMNHLELYRRRPDVAHLTEFYLWMSFGGVLGGMACSLLAPQILSSTIEYQLLLAAGVAGQAAIWTPLTTEQRAALATALKGMAIAIVPIALVLLSPVEFVATRIAALILLTMLTVAAVILRRDPRLGFLCCIGAVAAVGLGSLRSDVLVQNRGFFGVVQVVETGRIRTLVHGTTNHGSELTRDEHGRAYPRPSPLGYYHVDNPIAQGLFTARAVATGTAPMSVGIVGLGIGAISCHAHPGEQWAYFEIDPLVVEIATDPKYFTYLSKCPPSGGIKLGDARLTLQKEPVAAFDYLLIDAFSSDVVPVHLLTREAIAMYLERLKPGGVLAMHVSSRYLDLSNVAAATAADIPGAQVTLLAYHKDVSMGETRDAESAILRMSSEVAFISRDPDTTRQLRALPGAKPWTGKTRITPWTDDYSDIVGSMARRSLWQQ